MLLQAPSEDLHGRIVDDHVVLDIVGQEQHYWSPQLNFRIEPSESNAEETVIAGHIGPRPAVWTLFMFIYFGVGIIGFFIGSFGFIKWFGGTYSHLVLALPIAILFMLTAYATSKYGETLAKEQTEVLKQFIRVAISFE